jgi:hypothetical protein
VSERGYETDEFVDSVTASNDTIAMHATPGGRDSNHLCCVSKTNCQDDGTINAVGNSPVVNSGKAVLILSAQTSFRYQDPEAVAMEDARNALAQPRLADRHIEDFKSLFARLKLELCPETTTQTTDERLLGFRLLACCPLP